MALRDYFPGWWGSRKSVTTPVTNVEVMDVGKDDVPTTPNVGVEYGASGTENFGGYIKKEDYNPKFDDFQQAVRIYEEMRRSDAQIRSMLEVVKLPLRGATWTAVPPEGGDAVDQQIADFINATVFDDDAMDHSWDFVLRHILLQLDFGFSVLELVFRVDEDGYYRLKKLAPRLPRTIREWRVQPTGDLYGVVQYVPVPSSGEMARSPVTGGYFPVYRTQAAYEYKFIPAAYLVVCTNQREGDNYAGISLLRTVYRNWWYKNEAYKQEGVALDRYAVGIPVAELEENNGLQKQDLQKLRDMLKGIRSNERAYVVTPPHVKLKILPEGGMGGARSTSMSWIEHHDTQIARNILAGFLTMGQAPLGAVGFGSRLTDMFVSSLSGVAKGIAGDLKSQLVKPLCDLNFDMTRRQYPSVVVRDLEDVDLENLINVFSRMTGTVLTATDDDESMLRKILGLPPLPADMTRTAREDAAKAAASPDASLGANGLPVAAHPESSVPGIPGTPPAVPAGSPVIPVEAPESQPQPLPNPLET